MNPAPGAERSDSSPPGTEPSRNPSPGSEEFWRPAALDPERVRVFGICAGCRLCADLCPVFPALFRRVEEGPAAAPLPDDLCFHCGRCYVNCPYTPPHRLAVDFPHLMLRSVLVRRQPTGLGLRERIRSSPDLTGAFATLTAGLANRALRNRPFRTALEAVLGVDRRRRLPSFDGSTFDRWFQKRVKRFRRAVKGDGGKVVLFHTCMVNYCRPQVGRAAVAVLHHNDVGVAVPPQRCCGMPHLEAGDHDGALGNLRENVRGLSRFVEQGYTVVVPEATCGHMLKTEYPWLAGGADVRSVSERTMDLGEYLLALHAQGRLRTDFRELRASVACQVACRMKAQNLSRVWESLLALVPGLRPRLIDRCCAQEGRWGLEKEFYEESVRVAAPLAQDLRAAAADRVVSGCFRASLHIGRETGSDALHPVEILHEAYGLNGRE